MTTLLRPRIPRLVEPRPARHLIPGRPLPREMLPRPPAAPQVAGLPMFGFMYYTYNQVDANDWSPSTMLGSVVSKGYQANVWVDYLTERCQARGGDPSQEIIETPTTLQLKGEANFDLAAAMDVVVLGHDPPPEHLAQIRARSVVGTKIILGFHNFESIAQAVQWQPRFNGLREALKPYTVVGKVGSGCDLSSFNAYGCRCIDQYEINDSNGTPGSKVLDLCTGNPTYPQGYVSCPPVDATSPETKHSWDIDVYRASNNGSAASARLAAYWAALVTAADADYGARPWPFDGLLIDNLKSSPFKGSSTLDYPDAYPGQYASGWQAYLDSFKLYFGLGGAAHGALDTDWGLWCNYGPWVTTYTAAQIKNRFLEHAFRGGINNNFPATKAELLERLELVEEWGTRLVLGQTTVTGSAHYWYTTSGSYNPTTHGDWAWLIAQVESLGIKDLVYAQAVRTVSGSYIAWQEGWREPGAVA